MYITRGLFSSESVSEGHPDKLADRISDYILDAFLTQDPLAHVACETLITDQYVLVAGEFKTKNSDDFNALRHKAEHLVRHVLRDTGYNDAETGINPDTCTIDIRFNHQSMDIYQGVKRSAGILGAGDQGLMFGYACKETPELMPIGIHYAHRLMQYQATLRHNGDIPWLRPDAKTQVSVKYTQGKPEYIETVVLSTQHDASISSDTVCSVVTEEIIYAVIPQYLRSPNMRILINPTGRFVIGGPKGDTGLTGRKIIVDTYGGAAPHGGGCFSGKDPTKVDRCAAYMARFLAKNIVAHGWADRALIQIAYAIGVAEPVSFIIETFGTHKRPNTEITAELLKTYDLRPAAIIEQLALQRPIYYPTATYGHFGREDIDAPWENV